MKYITFLFLSIFLVSCGQAVDKQISNNEEITNSEIEKELSSIDTTDKVSTEDSVSELSNIEKITTKYNNPKGEVTINVEYSLDSDGKIETIATTSDYDGNADLTNNVQVVVWKTIQEAIDTDISGGSLTNAAFKNALKTQLEK